MKFFDRYNYMYSRAHTIYKYRADIAIDTFVIPWNGRMGDNGYVLSRGWVYRFGMIDPHHARIHYINVNDPCSIILSKSPAME